MRKKPGKMSEKNVNKGKFFKKKKKNTSEGSCLGTTVSCSVFRLVYLHKPVSFIQGNLFLHAKVYFQAFVFGGKAKYSLS